MAKKQDLINILVEDYGYEKEDLKFDAEGKPYTNAKLEALINAEKEDAEKAEIDSKRIVVATKSALKDSDLIYVMNGLSGTLIYSSQRTNQLWEFNRFGEQDTMEYGELKAMRNRYPRYLTEGWLLVLDKTVQDEFKLTEMYEHVLTPDNIDSIFDLPVEEIEKFIDALPEGQKISLVNKAQDLYEKDELNNFKVIKMIEKKFNFHFEDNSPLENIIDTREKVGSAKLIVVEKR